LFRHCSRLFVWNALEPEKLQDAFYSTNATRIAHLASIFCHRPSDT